MQGSPLHLYSIYSHKMKVLYSPFPWNIYKSRFQACAAFQNQTQREPYGIEIGPSFSTVGNNSAKKKKWSLVMQNESSTNMDHVAVRFIYVLCMEKCHADNYCQPLLISSFIKEFSKHKVI